MSSNRKSARFLAIADLVLTSILALIALTSKKEFKVKIALTFRTEI